MTLRPFTTMAVLLAVAGCDNVGRENGRPDAVPKVEAPRLSPVELEPPRIERSPTGRVKIVDPPRVDSIQVDLLKQSDGVVDIIWIIDDSGSMVNERKKLVSNFGRFLQELLALRVDFQMGVTSIVFSDGGRLRGNVKILKNLTPIPRRSSRTTPPSPTRARGGNRACA